jgi:hypothetical protein
MGTEKKRLFLGPDGANFAFSSWSAVAEAEIARPSLAIRALM